jgi:hypothetical protein
MPQLVLVGFISNLAFNHRAPNKKGSRWFAHRAEPLCYIACLTRSTRQIYRFAGILEVSFVAVGKALRVAEARISAEWHRKTHLGCRCG